MAPKRFETCSFLIWRLTLISSTYLFCGQRSAAYLIIIKGPTYWDLVGERVVSYPPQFLEEALCRGFAFHSVNPIIIQNIESKCGFWSIKCRRKQPVAKKLFMLQTRTRAVTEPDTMLKNTIHMDNCHVAISKQVVILQTRTT